MNAESVEGNDPVLSSEGLDHTYEKGLRVGQTITVDAADVGLASKPMRSEATGQIVGVDEAGSFVLVEFEGGHRAWLNEDDEMVVDDSEDYD